MLYLQQFIDEQNLHRTEGRRGVVNLCKIAAAIGYKDPQYFGQMERGAVLGDLICFLEDNPGAVSAIMEWIERVGGDEWDEQLEGQVTPDEDEDEE